MVEGAGEAESGGERGKPAAIFIAFGTQGDVYPISAVAVGLAKIKHHLSIHIITHAAHKRLMGPLSSLGISFVPITSPPAMCYSLQTHIMPESIEKGQSNSWKQKIEKNHREECLSAVDKIMSSHFRKNGSFIIINFFALDGWHLAELYNIPCIVAAPYVVPYSAPSTFERRFRTVNPRLYEKLKMASPGKVGWDDVLHWMWPLFTEHWSDWRSEKLHLSPCPLTDPVTEIPIEQWPDQPLLLYGFSKEVVECPSYWPSSVHVCGFWHWDSIMDSLIWEDSFQHSDASEVINFTKQSNSPPICIGLSSIGSLGFLDNPEGMLSVLEFTLVQGDHRAILLTSSHSPLESAILDAQFRGANDTTDMHSDFSKGVYLFGQRLLCVSCSLPYLWLFPRCSLVIHHGGSGTTAAALKSGTPQVICPFILDQFYWAEKMAWIGVAPEPLKREDFLPSSISEKDTGVRKLLAAISKASSPEIKACAAAIREKLRAEDGVRNAVEILSKVMSISIEEVC